MVNLYECHFTYNGVNSRNYDLIIANIETERFRPIAGEKKGVFLFNRNSKANELLGDDYKDSPLSIEIEILTCRSRALDLKTVKEVERWLFSDSIFRRLYIDMNDDPYGETYEMIGGIQKRLYFNCRFLYAEKIESHGGIIGWKCTMETDSMMMWQDEITHVLNFKDQIEYDDGGVTRKILLGDVDLDGRLTATDAQMVQIAVTAMLVASEPINTWEDLHEVVDPAFDEPLSDYQLIACDMDYTTDDYNNHELPRIGINDAQRILVEYVADLVYFPPVKKTIIIEDDEAIVIVDDNTRIAKVEIDTDIDGYTYPELVIHTGKSDHNTISILNTNDKYISTTQGNIERKTVFTDIPAYQTITIDSRTNYVSDGLYQKMSQKFFPRFVSGINTLEITGDISDIVITWQNRRYL